MKQLYLIMLKYKIITYILKAQFWEGQHSLLLHMYQMQCKQNKSTILKIYSFLYIALSKVYFKHKIKGHKHSFLNYKVSFLTLKYIILNIISIQLINDIV